VANPQLENGHTRIANEILEALIRINLSGQEMSAALYVIRKTYGYGKKEDYIALSQFQEALNISKTRASQVINSLQLKKILTVKENINGLTKKYIFNKYLKEWDIPSRKTLTVKEKRNDRSSISKEPLRKTLTTKETLTKDNTTKEIITGAIEYLNLKTEKNFKSSSKATRDKIIARINEGFTLDDFKKVIDNKVAQWKHDPKMNAYLRPETLFSPKFESYLNEKPVDPRYLPKPEPKMPEPRRL